MPQNIKNNQLGLSTTEAEVRQKQFGSNTIFQKKKLGLVYIFLDKLKNPLFILMIAISLVSFAVGQRASALIMLAMVFLSAALDFFNTFKSQKTVDGLAAQVATKALVWRDGEKKEIAAADIVPDDIVILSAGNLVPADCRIIASDDFFVNQSSLTGESIPVEKFPSSKTETASESPDIIYMGTSVISGYAQAKVLKIGRETEFGKIANALDAKEPLTDFETSMTKFSFFIMKLIFFMVSFVLGVYLIKNAGQLDRGIIIQAFTFALAVTIGVTPDMLPAIITVCLSKGSQLMAKKSVIVKHLSSIENFGSMDILCADKTGTLTQDKITLVKHLDWQGQISNAVLALGHLGSHFQSGVPNPLDNAIDEFKDIDISGYEKIDEIPYDFERKRSSMVVAKDGRRQLIVKGAPEETVKICDWVADGENIEAIADKKTAIEKQFQRLSQDGFRVLAIAFKDLPDEKISIYHKTIETGLVFAGYLAFFDPPKDDAGTALKAIKQLGIGIKIITGDNELLAKKICRDIGLEITGLLTGKEIENLNDFELEQKAIACNIFARINPIQKEKIILALKKSGRAVGYLGDGINDAPALKAADVGISVNNAVDIAKDTADIILLEKDLSILRDGIIEGRKTFHNTMKYVLMGLSSNFGNMFSMMGAATFLPFLPMQPAQILFNNFIYDASQFSLPTDDVDEDELLRPAHWDISFIRRYMIVFGLISSIFDFLTFIMLYFVFHLSEHQFQTGWFLESMATQILVVYIIRTKKIPFLQSWPSRSLLLAALTAVIIAWATPYTPLGDLLDFVHLPAKILGIILSYVIIYLCLVEIAKRIFYRYHRKTPSQIQ